MLLTATEHWDWHFHGNIYYNLKILLLRGNGQIKGHHFVCKVRVFPSVHLFHISTLNFTCHFILQSLSLINSFCQSSHSTLAFVVSPAMNNFASSAPFVLALFIPSSRWFINMLNSPCAHSDLNRNPLVTFLHQSHASNYLLKLSISNNQSAIKGLSSYSITQFS